MEIWEDRQRNPVADEVSALVAVTGPVIAGVLRSVSADVPSEFGDRDRLPLKLLGRLSKETADDCGIAFEYAVHEAVLSGAPTVVEAIQKFAQPGLLTTSREVVPDVPFATTATPATSIIITPIPRLSGTPAEREVLAL